MGKFFLGMLVGGVAGAIAWNSLRKTDYYRQVQEAVQNIKGNSNPGIIEEVAAEVQQAVEEVKDAAAS